MSVATDNKRGIFSKVRKLSYLILEKLSILVENHILGGGRVTFWGLKYDFPYAFLGVASLTDN